MVGSSGDAASCLSTQEVALLTSINQYRSQHGLPHLKASGKLNRAAYQHSLDMAERGYLAHDTRDPLPAGQSGPTYQHRIADNGYAGSPVGENIAGGTYTTGESVFNVWRTSNPNYEANMLNATFTHVGIGYVSMPGGPYANYWTADFGSGNDPPASGCGQ